jgi:hypothetical protein
VILKTERSFFMIQDVAVMEGIDFFVFENLPIFG